MKQFIKFIPLVALALLFIITSATPALAQEDDNRGDRRGDRRGRMDWNNMSEEQQKEVRARFEERRQEMQREQSQRMRENLELTEEEFGAIEPMIQRVQQLSMESLMVGRNPFGDRGRGGPGGGRGFNPFGDDENMSPQAKAVNESSDALRETLDNEQASSDTIKEQLAALRKARNALQDVLRQAREELRDFVTPEQEAKLVLQGLLD